MRELRTPLQGGHTGGHRGSGLSYNMVFQQNPNTHTIQNIVLSIVLQAEFYCYGSDYFNPFLCTLDYFSGSTFCLNPVPSAPRPV